MGGRGTCGAAVCAGVGVFMGSGARCAVCAGGLRTSWVGVCVSGVRMCVCAVCRRGVRAGMRVVCRVPLWVWVWVWPVGARGGGAETEAQRHS